MSTKQTQTLVVALGGNALGKSCEEQQERVRLTAGPIADLIESGHKVVLTHGNGPQVGMINQAFADYDEAGMPFPECGAMSQGYIGYHLQNALQNELKSRGIEKQVAALVTRVLVDPADPAFKDPSKPVGRFYNKEEAEQISAKYGYIMAEDANRGYRRYVPSPRPRDIIEKDVIVSLVESDCTVIASGGGGVPVMLDEKGALTGLAAVIDKDLSAALLAQLIDADFLLILTAVENVCLNYGKENEQSLAKLSLEEAGRYVEEGHFAKGSMLPKILAATEFVASKEGRKALITSNEKVTEALAGKTGTLICG